MTCCLPSRLQGDCTGRKRGTRHWSRKGLYNNRINQSIHQSINQFEVERAYTTTESINPSIPNNFSCQSDLDTHLSKILHTQSRKVEEEEEVRTTRIWWPRCSNPTSKSKHIEEDVDKQQQDKKNKPTGLDQKLIDHLFRSFHSLWKSRKCKSRDLGHSIY
jgi:hypothetical protein